MKTVKNTRSPYFDCFIQTDDKSKVRAVCYDPQKRISFQQAYQSKSLIKISAVKRQASNSFSEQMEEFKVLKQAKIVPTKTTFQYNTAIGSSLHTVEEALSGGLYKTIDIKVKVMSKATNKQAIVYNGKQIMKVDCIVADHTNTIKLVLWEEHIDKVDCGKTYLFKTVKIRIFDDTKYLSTNQSTTIELQSDLQDINLNANDIKDNIIEGQCIGIQLKKQPACVACNTCFEEPLPTDNPTMTCKSCKITTLSTTCNHKLVCQMMVKTKSGKLQNYTCFNDAIESFLATILDIIVDAF